MTGKQQAILKQYLYKRQLVIISNLFLANNGKYV